MMKFTITGLDPDGNIVYNETTKEKWFLSEVDYHLHQLKPLISSGEVATVLIENVTGK